MSRALAPTPAGGLDDARFDLIAGGRARFSRLPQTGGLIMCAILVASTCAINRRAALPTGVPSHNLPVSAQ